MVGLLGPISSAQSEWLGGWVRRDQASLFEYLEHLKEGPNCCMCDQKLKFTVHHYFLGVIIGASNGFCLKLNQCLMHIYSKSSNALSTWKPCTKYLPIVC